MNASQPATAVAKAKNQQRQRMLRVCGTLIAIACFVVAALIATTASGQGAAGAAAPYKFTKPDPRYTKEGAVKKMKSEIRTYASTGEGDMRYVGAYFTKYVYPLMTSVDGVRQITPIVNDLNTYLSRAAKSNRSAVYQNLVKQTARVMKPMAEGNFHPSARIAAITVLSQLDGRLANLGAKQPPQPLAPVLGILVNLYEKDSNEGVKAAALHGIHRHVSYGFRSMSPDVKTKVSSIMTALIDADPPLGRSPAAHAFLQRYAIDCLYYLQPDGDDSLADKLVSISTDSDANDLLALYSTSRLGLLNTSLEGKFESTEDVLARWAKLAANAFEQELERFALMEKRRPVSGQPRDPKTFLQSAAEAARARSMPGMGMEGMMGPPPGMGMEGMMGPPPGSDMEGMMGPMNMFGTLTPKYQPQSVEVTMSRRQLNYVLQQIHRGATGSSEPEIPSKPAGLLAAVGADDEDVNSWIEKIEAAIEVVNDPSLDSDTKFLRGIEEQLEILKEMVGEEPTAVAVAGNDLGDDNVLGDDPLGGDPLGGDPLGG